MTQFDITVAGNRAVCTGSRGILTAGMTGASVTLAWDNAWAGLQHTGVFRCGEKSVDVLPEGSTVAIPAGILLPDETLYFGLYGTDGETVVLPTVWAALATVHPAADPSGDEAADPTLPVWAQLQARLEDLETPDIAAAVAAYLEENPPVGQKGEQGDPGPQGEQGDPGADGYTPVRGTDYWTESDKAEIKAYVEEAILGGAW